MKPGRVPRVVWALLLPLATGAALAAGENAVLRCLDVADATERLACYDVAARALRAETERSREQDFGRKPPAKPQAAAPERLDSQITGTFSGWNAGSTVQLANGQVWQLVDEGTVFAPLHNPKVRISPGFMGLSHFMEVDGLSFQIRVKRLK